MASGRFVAYYRVSTKRQGRSGLGLEAQQEAVTGFLNGGRWRLVAEFTEVESGRRSDRPELHKALAACRLYGATLVVARFDRLSRNAAFLLTLRDSGVRFVAADVPEANELTVGVLALVAQHEAEAISSRTKGALAAAKRRGVKLGNPAHLTDPARRRGTSVSATVRKASADRHAGDMLPLLSEFDAAGLSLRQQAAELNARELPAPRGGAWSAATVLRVRRRMVALATDQKVTAQRAHSVR